MFAAKIPNRNSNPTYLIRESYREGKKVKQRTIGNISKLPLDQIMAIKQILNGVKMAGLDEIFEIQRSLPHGHVAAMYGMIKAIGLDKIIYSKSTIQRELILAMIIMRIIKPSSKLSTAQSLYEETIFASLSQIMGLPTISEDDLYKAMDSLMIRQEAIEKKIAKNHISNGSLFMFDLTSTCFEGKKCPLARFGYNRDGKKGKLQIVIGLLCTEDGCPISVNVYEGNTSDAKTIIPEIRKIRERFGIKKIIIVGDRGMITNASTANDFKSDADHDWVTALRSSSIKTLVENKELDVSIFDERNPAEITSTDYPNERLIVCKNPFLVQERIEEDQQLDGFYILRTSLKSEYSEEKIVEYYKQLSKVERAFRCLKTVSLKVRPIYHHREKKVKSHVFICCLAYYVEWHVREKLKTILYHEENHEPRKNYVEPYKRSEEAKQKDASKMTADGYPVHSFDT
jgi:transposase